MKSKGKFREFARDIGLRESGGRYDAINKWGFLGKYQFGKARLTDLGLMKKINENGTTKFVWTEGLSTQKFLSSPEIQEWTFEESCRRWLVFIQKNFRDYIGKTINGVYITESGLVAGLHLLGPGGVRRFLEKGYDGTDALGTKISEYIERFGGYDLSELLEGKERSYYAYITQKEESDDNSER